MSMYSTFQLNLIVISNLTLFEKFNKHSDVVSD